MRRVCNSDTIHGSVIYPSSNLVSVACMNLVMKSKQIEDAFIVLYISSVSYCLFVLFGKRCL